MTAKADRNARKTTIKNLAQFGVVASTANAGLAILPEFLATKDRAPGHISYVLPDWELDPLNVYAKWPSNALKNGLIKLLINELSEQKPRL
ncbi:hypothetical protein F9L33_01180 [Amylibacter sp. SFDW26]|uniref:hypothetical protein n=1 Tax=Amylibacter sp. SFDW26 TaxID=2652722 RepID=UPI0012625B0C|nr:hypothetical protein [Amylibacter sp. SFDW26]KAB7615408.1 hypothetical protein F9L33_01180 [Amylibacter sp. SFDW26]